MEHATVFGGGGGEYKVFPSCIHSQSDAQELELIV